MSESQAWVLLRVIHRMILMATQNRPITTTDLQEWSREVAWAKES